MIWFFHVDFIEFVKRFIRKISFKFFKFRLKIFLSIFIEFFVVNVCAKTLKNHEKHKNTKIREKYENTKNCKKHENWKKIMKNTKNEKNEICEWRKNVQIVCYSIDEIEIFEKTSKNKICKRKKNIEIVDSFVDQFETFDKM